MSRACVRAIIVLACTPGHAEACTTFAAGKKATKDGSVIVSQSSDADPLQDARIFYVPARDHVPNAMRPVYDGNEHYPRYVSTHFGPDYYPDRDTGARESEPIGYIPQVSHTYGYQDTSYGYLNEHNVGIGETTCSSMFQTCAKGASTGCEEGRKVGDALMSVDTLTKLAMERAKTSREAVQLMGDMAVKYGFFGTADDNGHGEALQVGDADEAFTFNILADPTGTSAIWAARRVPDENVTVMANMFTIREVDVTDPFNYLASPNIFSIAEARGWWKPGTPFDFTRIYSNGEYANKYYSGRRMWGAFRLIAPSQKLSHEYDDIRYDRMWPWSMKPDELITVHDVMRYYRDWYGGTAFDLTKGVAAGPFGTPDRFKTKVKGGDPPSGAWERSIAIYRTSDVRIQQLRKETPDLPRAIAGLSWVAAGAPHYAPFLPLPSGITRSMRPLANAVPKRFDRGSMNWAIRRVSQACQLRFDKMHPVVEQQQALMEDSSDLSKLMQEYAAAAKANNDGALNKIAEDWVVRALETWGNLADELPLRFMENYDLLHHTENHSAMLQYPDSWLHASGYFDGPPPVPVETQCPPKCPSGSDVVV